MKNFIRLFLAGALMLGACSKDDAAPDPVGAGSVSLDKTELTLHRGQSETLTATVLPAEAEDKSVAWRSSDPKMATVSNAGAVSVAASGTAMIAAGAGGLSAACVVTVAPGIFVAVDENNADFMNRKSFLWKKGVSTTLPEGAAAKSVFVC